MVRKVCSADNSAADCRTSDEMWYAYALGVLSGCEIVKTHFDQIQYAPSFQPLTQKNSAADV